MVSRAAYVDCLKLELLHRLAREYHPAMDEEGLHVWASKVVKTLTGSPAGSDSD